MLGRFVNKLIYPLGYKIIKPLPNEKPEVQYGAEFLDIVKKAEPFTMTSIERMFALYQAVQYVVNNKVHGDYVECGVWRGGSSMVAALAFIKRNDISRKFYLYDTFEGMSQPGKNDKYFKGESVIESWDSISKKDKIFCYAGLAEVKENMVSTGYPENQIEYIQGKVEETMPGNLPEKISILRLDTDWYESTKHELKHLYPIVTQGGVVILDDYGHWVGAKKAVDEYFSEYGFQPLLQRIDYSGRIFIKY